MSASMALRRSPKPGALTATEAKVPRILLTTSAASASPSTSSATTTSGRDVCMTFSSSGTRSRRFDTLELTRSRYGFSSTASIRSVSVTMYGEMYPLSKRMPSTRSMSMPKVFDSSTVITPSLPTLSIASEMIRPISGSAAEMPATWAIWSLESTSTARSAIRVVAAATAASMPRFTPTGLAPAARLRRP